MNEITITVCGIAGSGKTTLAHLVHTMLREQGFESELEDIDQPISPERLKACLKALPGRTRIRVVAKMAPRAPKHNVDPWWGAATPNTPILIEEIGTGKRFNLRKVQEGINGVAEIQPERKKMVKHIGMTTLVVRYRPVTE